MPIRYYGGVEGSGKSCMMTRDLFLHYMSGGEVWSFPGYELYGDTKRQVLSIGISPEEILTLLQNDTGKLRRRRIALAIDEVGNFMNHHNWWSKICDIMFAISAQRRKLGIALLMTGPIYYKLPPDMRDMIHEVVNCQDNHTFNHSIRRGEQCVFYKEDMRGLLSNPRHRFSHKKVFHMKPWYKHYDTYAAVDPLNQFIKLKFKGREVIVGADGKILNAGYDINPSKFDGIVKQFTPAEDLRVNQIKGVLGYLKGKGIQTVETKLISELLNIPHLLGRDGAGSILTSLGAKRKGYKKAYDLTGVSL